MTNRIDAMHSRRLLQAASSITVLGLALAASSACDQPKVRCHATAADANARYVLVTKTPLPKECDAITLPGTPSADPTQFPLGIESFVPNPSDSNAYTEQGYLTLKAGWIGQRIHGAQVDAVNPANNPPTLVNDPTLINYPYGSADATPPPPPDFGGKAPKIVTNFPYAWGKFDTVYPDNDNICTVSTMNASDLVYPAVPSYMGPDPNSGAIVQIDKQDQTAVKYAWSNVRVYVSPDSIGTQTFADLNVTQDGCALKYQVSILTPKVPCGKEDPPGSGKFTGDPTLCAATPTDTNPFGSGIGQGIDVKCENVNPNPDPTSADFECLPTKMAP